MDLIIVIVIVVAAAAYLIRRAVKHGPGSSCGCDCASCIPSKDGCTANGSDARNKE